MGARLAPQKSMTFSPCKVSREWLKKHRWRCLGRTVPKVTDFRDLGEHLNTTARHVGTTPTQRIRKATRATAKLNRRKAKFDDKAAVIRVKFMPMGLYDCEVAPINEAVMKAYRAETASTLTYSTTRRSTDLTFDVASRGADLDHDIEVVVGRVVAMRRAYSMDDEAKVLIKEFLLKYDENKAPGLGGEHESLRDKVIGGDPMQPERARLRKECRVKDPLG